MQIKINWKFSKITNCMFHDNSDCLIGGTERGSFFTYKMSENKMKFYNLYKPGIKYMLIEAGLLYTIFSDGKCRIIDFEKFNHLKIFRNFQAKQIEDIDCYEKIIVTTDNKGMIRLWDTRIKTYFESIYHGPFGIRITRFLHKSLTLIASNQLSEIFIWDIRKIQKSRKVCCGKNTQKILINSLLVSKNRKFFFVCDVKNNFFQCRANSKAIEYRKLQKISAFRKNVKKKLSSDTKGDFVGYGDHSGNIFIWSQANGKLIYDSAEICGKITCFNFHPTDRLFCVYENKGDIFIKKFL